MVLGAVGLMKLVFQVPFRGGYVLVMPGAALCVLCGIGIRTFIATFTKTSAQAQLTSFFANPTPETGRYGLLGTGCFRSLFKAKS